MRILYITKENPKAALGHAAERARQFILELKNFQHDVRCVYPSKGEDGGLSDHRSDFEKLSSIFKSYHERRAGKNFCVALKKLIEVGQFDFIVAEELSSAYLALRFGTKASTLRCQEKAMD